MLLPEFANPNPIVTGCWIICLLAQPKQLAKTEVVPADALRDYAHKKKFDELQPGLSHARLQLSLGGHLMLRNVDSDQV